MEKKDKKQELNEEELDLVTGGSELLDDPTAERMRVQIRSLDQDNRNTQNGNSMMKEC